MVKPDGKKRISRIDTYLNVAETFAYRSTCLKRKYGAVIVKDDTVISLAITVRHVASRIVAMLVNASESVRICIRARGTECARLFTLSRMHFLIAPVS